MPTRCASTEEPRWRVRDGPLTPIHLRSRLFERPTTLGESRLNHPWATHPPPRQPAAGTRACRAAIQEAPSQRRFTTLGSSLADFDNAPRAQRERRLTMPPALMPTHRFDPRRPFDKLRCVSLPRTLGAVPHSRLRSLPLEPPRCAPRLAIGPLENSLAPTSTLPNHLTSTSLQNARPPVIRWGATRRPSAGLGGSSPAEKARNAEERPLSPPAEMLIARLGPFGRSADFCVPREYGC